MRKEIFILAVILTLLIAGCSGAGKSAVVPQSDDISSGTSGIDNSNEMVLLASGTMNVSDGSLEFSDRSADAYYNITSLLGSRFSYTIDGVIPPDILDITLRISNATISTVHDVIIVFENLYGKTVMNPDSYVDIFQPYDIDPFIAFMTSNPNRAFGPGVDIQELHLKFPAGANPMVDYFILAHLGGNTGGVYEIRNWSVQGHLTPDGGSSLLQVTTLDHQDNVSQVVADTTVFTGGYTNFTPTADPEIWNATISNTAGAPVGEYTVLVMANSPASPNYNTYNYFNISVVDSQPGISSVAFAPKPANNTWHDVCVQYDGPVYIAADHPDSGNVNGTRTAIRFNNDLTGMTVLNPGTGINNGYTIPFTKIDVTDGGLIVNNPELNRQSSWTDSGGSSLDEELCCMLLNYCVNGEVKDFYNVNYQGNSYIVGYLEFVDCLQAGKSRVWPEANPTGTYGGGMFLDPNYDHEAVRGADGVEGTNEGIYFISSATEGYISRSGDWILPHGEVVELQQAGTLGTGNGQFTGGLDVAVDSAGNIITLEGHGGSNFRFQKFDAEMNWVYTSIWKDDGNPSRMDFDCSDNQLYLISTAGVYIMAVE